MLIVVLIKCAGEGRVGAVAFLAGGLEECTRRCMRAPIGGLRVDR